MSQVSNNHTSYCFKSNPKVELTTNRKEAHITKTTWYILKWNLIEYLSQQQWIAEKSSFKNPTWLGKSKYQTLQIKRKFDDLSSTNIANIIYSLKYHNELPKSKAAVVMI